MRVLAAAFGLLLLGTAPTVAQVPGPGTDINMVRVKAATESFHKASVALLNDVEARGCGPSFKAVSAAYDEYIDMIQHIREFARYHRENGAYELSKLDDELGDAQVEYLAKSMFNMADSSLRKHCFEVADRFYRTVLSTFTGSRYAALRQRAQVGIDDVRAARPSR